MERFESLEDLALHKAKIFEGATLGAKAVINSDIPFFDKILQKAKQCHREVITYGTQVFANFKFLTFVDQCLSFEVNNEVFSVNLSTHETHQAMNFLANLSILEALRLDWKSQLSIIAERQKVEEGRGNEITILLNSRKSTFIDNAYNSSPLSLCATLESFSSKKLLLGKKIAVLTDMLELGDNTLDIHQNVIDKIASLDGLKYILIVGDVMSKVEVRDKHIIKFDSIDAVFEYLEKNIETGDNIFFKGSNSTGLRDKMLTFISEKCQLI